MQSVPGPLRKKRAKMRDNVFDEKIRWIGGITKARRNRWTSTIAVFSEISEALRKFGVDVSG
jgi:hypothetical protein